jgi:hypothetical protein
MTQQELDSAAIHSMIAIAIPVLLIIAVAILYHVTAKKAHKQNLQDLNSRYSMPKK